ncbi:hypothetical protein C1645_745807 [Glomus cerebriforme]|uniref:Uncharacterized protein n=1 Tax=Glomus cerebriforme TaxID=658196 RepID=A0A397SA60_9GLOM|nr:hypothetical protein C1645_745807 [Glomus cerebriforme]
MVDNIIVNNNTSNSNDHKVYRYDDTSTRLGNIPRTGKDPPLGHTKQHMDADLNESSSNNKIIHNVDNHNNTKTCESRLSSRISPHENNNNNSIEAYETLPMQDVMLLAPINVSSNTIQDNVNDQPIFVDVINSPSPIIPMDTSFTNDPLIKKANKHKKKKSKQEPMMAGPSEFESPHVPTDMLIDVSEHAIVPSEQISPNVSILDHPTLISKEIMDITFNEIISESIDMIVDQLDSTHLSESNPNLTPDQLSARYSPSSTSTGGLDKAHSFTPSNTPISQIDSSIHPLSFDANVAIQRA